MLLVQIALAALITSASAVTTTDPAAFAAETFDYVVVGAGSAGMTVRGTTPLSNFN